MVISSLKELQECQENNMYNVLDNECEDNAITEGDNTTEEDLQCLAINYALTQTALGAEKKQRCRQMYWMTGH
jgi:hypothetical protein